MDVEKSAARETRGRADKAFFATALSLFLLALIVRVAFLRAADNNGTDAWARYLIARRWLEHPTDLPSEVWLPLPFWLLGSALWASNSEFSARLLTAFFGATTILPYWGMLRRIFDSRVALWSAVFFALFGFHVAYSVTTSSEAPTIFFLVLGLYAWVRFYFDDGWRWVILSGAAFSAASLCRVEPWLYLPVLAIVLLSLSGGTVGRPTSRSWMRLAGFSLAAAPGVIGWIVYSLIKWGQPFSVANRSAGLSAHFSIQQPLFNRLIAVPGALLITLSPLVIVLILLGLSRIRHHTEVVVMVPAVLVAVLASANVLLAVQENLTMARYTLMYSWLLIPYAFEGLAVFASKWPWLENWRTFAGVLIFFFVWQAGLVAGAYYGPPKIADKLSSVSPTLPLGVELRDLVRWLDKHRSPGDAVIFDHFNYEATDVIRYARVPSSDYFLTPEVLDPPLVHRELRDFIVSRHPRFLVYSPAGLLRGIWSVDNPSQIIDNSNLVLSRQWQEGNWQVYRISYEDHP
jgi:4-amino-4-deoxy-L-arabinose transferase-like glycosyltransferase